MSLRNHLTKKKFESWLKKRGKKNATLPGYCSDVSTSCPIAHYLLSFDKLVAEVDVSSDYIWYKSKDMRARRVYAPAWVTKFIAVFDNYMDETGHKQATCNTALKLLKEMYNARP